MKGRNGNTDVDNELVDTVVEGGSGTNGESSINIYTLSYRKWIVGKKSLGSFSFKCLAKLYFMLFYSVLC